MSQTLEQSYLFYFQFADAFFGGKNPLSYVLLIVCFVLAWIETWFLDFKVVPVERKAKWHGEYITFTRI